MKFEETYIKDLYVIEMEEYKDERGSFARIYCKNEFNKINVNFEIVQANISHNHRKGVVRGMHYQSHPYEEAKLVRCITGSIFDVAVDMRKESKTYLKWFGIELSSKNKKALFIPKGFAHGYQTLLDDTEVMYFVDNQYSPLNELGVRYDEEKIGIKWPEEIKEISIKDSEIKRL